MPYAFTMKHDGRIVRAAFEDEEVWRSVKQTIDGREWDIGRAKGRPIDAAAIGAVRVQITSDQSDLEPMIPLKKRNAVSQTIRDFIESVEPGVHQFIPAYITLKDGSIPKESYYLINICNLVDALDLSRTQMTKSSYGSQFIASGKNDRIVLQEKKIDGLAIWIDVNVIGAEFMSDALHDKLHAIKCTRFDFTATAASGEKVS